ncbi:SH3 domain-containing protein [Limibaculum sp. FT325]|uniref:SH3 domain-containing protein n=1 Tax=Thermohalobaculum sediminis TaxID=2939436 RepID=UPI0020C0BCE8|nr:SH3 domain-containing protein [Limibaculum sediminis]MCL5778424.1 SH3 domain-containing protein [Limibaculum sediminis]
MNRFPLATVRSHAVAVLLLAPVAAAAAEVPAAPEDGGPRRFEVTGVTSALNLREEPSLASRIVARLAPGTVLSNLGCREAAGHVWCDVQNFLGGPRGYVDAAYLAPAVAPHGAVLTGPDTSALRAGQGAFEATGLIPCAQAAGQPMTDCAFGVARAGGGDATVVITKPDGTTRTIFFAHGLPLGADASQADPAAFDFESRRESDLNLIRVGAERYEIPDAVTFGG